MNITEISHWRGSVTVDSPFLNYISIRKECTQSLSSKQFPTQSSFHPRDQHLTGSLWFVHRNHVTSIIHLQELEVFVGAESSSSFTCTYLMMKIFPDSVPMTCSQCPGFILSCIESILAIPFQSLHPLFVSKPVTNIVNISGINQDLNNIIFKSF